MATSRLTQEQIDGIKAFANEISTDDMNNFMRALKFYRPIVGYEDLVDNSKNPWEYLPERFAKQTAIDAGCTADDRDDPATVRNKLIGWAQQGTSAPEMIQRVFDASVTIGILMQTLGEQPDDSETTDGGRRPIYGPTKANELGLPDDLTMTEVEDALAS